MGHFLNGRRARLGIEIAGDNDRFSRRLVRGNPAEDLPCAFEARYLPLIVQMCVDGDEALPVAAADEMRLGRGTAVR